MEDVKIAAEEFLIENEIDVKEEQVAIKSLGNHGQRVDWSQGQITEGKKNWKKYTKHLNMKNPTTTPGKWEITGNLDTLCVEKRRSDGSYALIAEIHTEDHNIPRYEEAYMNAKLIAESKNLLDSCYEYKNLLDLLIEDTELWDLLNKNNMNFASKVSLEIDLNRVIKRINNATK